VLLPNAVFYDYLRGQGKEGAMHKFPRVLKGKMWADWQVYVAQKMLQAD
jgi:hypothetical protein